MNYVNLGTTGLKVSRLCLGCMTYGVPERGDHTWTLPEEQSRPLLRQAIELGINFFDTADVYSDGTSEEIVGRALKDFAHRDEIVLATKVFYQIHRWDYTTPIEETLEALHDVVKAGKARYIGASSMYAWQFSKALGVSRQNGWTRFVSMQDHYNLLYREEEREMLPLCGDAGVGVLPWSPLARGRLTRAWGTETPRTQTDVYGKTLYKGEADQRIVAQVAAIATARGVPRAQVALAWIAQKSIVTAPIIGASKPQHLDDAVAALSLGLTPVEMAQLEAPYVPHSIVGHA